jgi:peptidoglycan biosynthesis protein MviN/MurJ (putative lipid II flippase)
VSKSIPRSASKDALSRSAFLAGLGGLFVLIAELGRQLIAAAVFGTGADVDAYLTALVVPHYLWSVLAAGLPFVVLMASAKEKGLGYDGDAWLFAGTFVFLSAGLRSIRPSGPCRAIDAQESCHPRTSHCAFDTR